MSHDTVPSEQSLDDIRKGIGKRIKALRLEKGMSQQNLADAVNVTVQAVSQWEVGKSSPDYLKLSLLGSLLETNVGYLIGGDEEYKNRGFYKSPENPEVPVIGLSEALDILKVSALDLEKKREYYKDHRKVTPTNISTYLQIAYRIDDDSMVPEFQIGDIIIIQSFLFPLPGDFVVFETIGKPVASFRKFRIKEPTSGDPNSMEFVPLNSYYPSESVVSLDSVFIHGTMVEHRRFRKR